MNVGLHHSLGKGEGKREHELRTTCRGKSAVLNLQVAIWMLNCLAADNQ